MSSEYLPLPTDDYDIAHWRLVASEEYERNKNFFVVSEKGIPKNNDIRTYVGTIRKNETANQL